MTLTAVILLLLAACTHAGWNFISKKQYPTLAFYFLANIFGMFCISPLISCYWDKIPLIPPIVWMFLLMSGFFLAVYMAAIAGAYRSGDLSIAYPLARSLPVIIVTGFSIAMGRGHVLGWLFFVGIILVVTGCLMLPMKALRDFHLQNYLNLCCLLAVLAAIAISGYTIVDDEALRRLRELPGKPFDPVNATLLYLVLEAVSSSLWKGTFVVCSAVERKNFAVVLRTYKSSAALTGIGIFLTYGLVLASMSYVTNVSYVAAFRQLSILIVAVLGMVLLKEPHHVPKVVGVILIFAGLVMVGIF